MRNFALIGAAGYVAPRHMRAVRETGNRLVAAADPHDSVGVLDRYFPEVRYFPEIERFDRHLEKLRRGSEERRVHWLSICSPNYLHDAHVRLGLRVGADVICEKPLVISPWNLDQLAALESESRGSVNTVLQLREHPAVAELRSRLSGADHEVELSYVTGRGSWYRQSWKGDEERSGGVAMNIGVHFFDLLLWLFGAARRAEVHLREQGRMAGFLELERARVRWLLSVDFADLPLDAAPGEQTTHRALSVDGREVELSGGFEDLHTRVYERTLAGEGRGIEDARPAIELVHRLRGQRVTDRPEHPHPRL